VPVPSLHIFRTADNLTNAACVRMNYAGNPTNPSSPSPNFHVIEGEKVILRKRDRKAEARALKQLAPFHLQPVAEAPDLAARHFDSQGMCFMAPGDALPWFWLDFMHEAAPRLREAGYEITVDDDCHMVVLDTDDETIEASFTQSGEWWFSLDLGITIDGQRTPLLPVLVALLRTIRDADDIEKLTARDKCYAPLADGRYVALPSARVKTILQTLIELFDDKPLDDKGRLRVSFDLATALLKVKDITRKRWLGEGQLKNLVEKLGDFEGIEDTALPPGLNAELRPYQKQGYDWLHFLGTYNLGGILADDMGLGKTVQALAYILSLKRQGRLGTCLVIMPTSLVTNWQTEAARFTPDLKVLTLHGGDRARKFHDIPDADVVLSTYPLIIRDVENLRAHKWGLVILDEAQAIKNPTSKMMQAVCMLEAKQRLCLTGTPVENHLGEVWSIFAFLMPGLLGDYRSFARLYRTPIEKGGDSERQNLLARRLRPFILRRLKSNVAKELPLKTEIIQRVVFGEDQRDLYETVRHVMNDKVQEVIAAKGLARSQIVILDALLKLRQVCCDPRLVKISAAAKAKTSAKLSMLLEMLPTLIEDGRRILLFSQFTSMLDLIKPELDLAGIPYVELRGTTKDRRTPIVRFQKKEVPLFLISLKAGGTGLNITAADTVIHFDPWWNPSVENQATDRAHRIGQDKPVFVYKLIVEGSIEERILDLQQKKVHLADALLGDGSSTTSALTQDDLQWLLESV
ncbi:MAG: DEAD/DEAH box helicase, partial [Pseudomonadota bacterium]|nr:DEAD/DEAH box helicase [Pseudomonadota bacterium]